VKWNTCIVSNNKVIAIGERTEAALTGEFEVLVVLSRIADRWRDLCIPGDLHRDRKAQFHSVPRPCFLLRWVLLDEISFRMDCPMVYFTSHVNSI
jgi:hypothetical protein